MDIPDRVLERVLGMADRLRGVAPETCYDEIERDETEIEAALEAACSAQPRSGLEVASLLQGFWFARGRLQRGRFWLDRLLEAAGPQPTAERASGLAASASLAFRQGDNDAAKRQAQQARTISRTLHRSDLEMTALQVLARAGLRDGDPAAVRLHATEAQKIAIELQDERNELQAIHCLAEAARMAGDLQEARALYTQSLQRNRARGAKLMVAVELTNFGYVEKARGRLDAAEASVREAVPIALEIRNTYVLAHQFVALAAIVAAARRGDEAARLLGKADKIFADSGLTLDPADKAEYDSAVTAARALLGEQRYEAVYAAGAELDPSAL